jgi:hypothetical protein
MYHDQAMESKMNRYFWPADHPAASLALVATAILVVAWPLENMPACALAAVMMVVAAGLAIRAHFHSAGMGY